MTTLASVLPRPLLVVSQYIYSQILVRTVLSTGRARETLSTMSHRRWLPWPHHARNPNAETVSTCATKFEVPALVLLIYLLSELPMSFTRLQSWKPDHRLQGPVGMTIRAPRVVKTLVPSSPFRDSFESYLQANTR